VKVRVGDFEGGMDALAHPMFLIEFEEAAVIAKWSYKRKWQELLKGPALMAVHSRMEYGTSTDFNTLSRALCAELLPPSATVRAHMQLNSCTQGDKSVTAYGEHLRRLAIIAYPPGSPEGQAAVRDRCALDRFVVTLKTGELRVKVLEDKPKSLRQAVNVAEEYAAIVDPNGDGGCKATFPTYLVQGIPADAAVPSARGPGTAAEHECVAAQAIRELTNAFQCSKVAQSRDSLRAAHSKEPRRNPKRGEKAPVDTPSVPRKCDATCYRCRNKGHYARECDISGVEGQVSCADGPCHSGTVHTCACATCHFPSSYRTHPNA
jgi:hypothetical protein